MIPISNRSWLLTWLCWSYQSSFHQPVLNFSSTCSKSSTFQITCFFHPSLQSWSCFFIFCMRYTLVPGQSSRRRATMEMRHARKLWQPVSSHLAQYVYAIFHVCITFVCSIICYVLNFATDKVDRGQWIHWRSSCDEVSLDWMSRF